MDNIIKEPLKKVFKAGCIYDDTMEDSLSIWVYGDNIFEFRIEEDGIESTITLNGPEVNRLLMSLNMSLD